MFSLEKLQWCHATEFDRQKNCSSLRWSIGCRWCFKKAAYCKQWNVTLFFAQLSFKYSHATIWYVMLLWQMFYNSLSKPDLVELWIYVITHLSMFSGNCSVHIKSKGPQVFFCKATEFSQSRQLKIFVVLVDCIESFWTLVSLFRFCYSQIYKLMTKFLLF